MLHKTWDMTMGRVNAFLGQKYQLPAHIYSATAPLSRLSKHPTAFSDRPKFADIRVAFDRGEFRDRRHGARCLRRRARRRPEHADGAG